MNDSGFFYQPKPEWNPHQLEIKFFWPLTEQIDLDLDFSQCSPHQYYIKAQGIAGVEGPFNTGMVFASSVDQTWSSSLHIDSETLTFNNLKMPWYRKVLFKLLGFKWKK